MGAEHTTIRARAPFFGRFSSRAVLRYALRMMMLWAAAAVALVLSLTGKILADAYLTGHVSLFGSWVGLLYSQNEGIAFGIALPSYVQGGLIFAAVLLVIWMAVASHRTMLSQIAYGLIIGGALGNIADRIVDGSVTDFVQIGTFPVFNVADSCISVGVAFLLLDLLLHRRHPSTVTTV